MRYFEGRDESTSMHFSVAASNNADVAAVCNERRPSTAPHLRPHRASDTNPTGVHSGQPTGGNSLALAARIRQVVNDLDRLGFGTRLGPTIRALRKLDRTLSRIPRIAIAGDVNSGKTSVTNLLLGLDSLPTATLANSRIPTRVHRSTEPCVHARFADGTVCRLSSHAPLPDIATLVGLDVGLPLPILERMDLVDCIVPQPGARFEDAGLESADVLIWCTPVTQAWRATEARLWSDLPLLLRRRSLLLATFTDLVTAEQRNQVVARLQDVVGHDVHDIVAVTTKVDAVDGENHRQRARQSVTAALDALLQRIREQTIGRACDCASRLATKALAHLG